MDNSLKAFEVGNAHLYGNAHAQAMVGFLCMSTLRCGDTLQPPVIAPQPPPPPPLQVPAGSGNHSLNRESRIKSLTSRGLQKLRGIFGSK